MISFTAEEIWQAMPHLGSDNKKSVFLNPLPEVRPEWRFAELEAHWDKLFSLRDDVMKALELARAEKLIGKSLDADLTVYATDKEVCELLDSFGEEALKTVFIVSDVQVKNEAARLPRLSRVSEFLSRRRRLKNATVAGCTIRT